MPEIDVQARKRAKEPCFCSNFLSERLTLKQAPKVFKRKFSHKHGNRGKRRATDKVLIVMSWLHVTSSYIVVVHRGTRDSLESDTLPLHTDHTMIHTLPVHHLLTQGSW